MTTPKEKMAAETWRKIEDMFREWQPLHDRMDEDYALWRLTPFQPDQREGIDPEDAFTSNEHRVMAEKIEAFISGAEVIIRVPDGPAAATQRQANDNLERLVIGMFANADERLHKKGDPSILSQLAWHSVVRGGFVVLRAFLRKDARGNTVEDILPVDPRHFVMDWGDDGPDCAALRFAKTRRRIRRDYPDYKFGDQDEDRGEDFTQVEVVNDYYYVEDGQFYNAVLINEKYAVRPQPLFGLTAFPVIAVPVGSQPKLATITNADANVAFDDTIKDFGESIFASGRDVVSKYNRLMSYAMSQAAQATDPGYVAKSLDGSFDPEQPPFARGQATPMSVANEEEIEALSTPDLRRDTQALLAAVRQGVTQAYLPEQAYGILPAPISSLALKQLGNNLEQKVFPRMRAVQACLRYAANNMAAQFETGAYLPIMATGKTYDRQPFSGPIMPEMVLGHGSLEITLEPNFPEDEAQRWQIAQLAATLQVAGVPVIPPAIITQQILKYQDSDILQAKVMELQARMSDPIALAMEMLAAAQKAGDEPLTMRWFDRIKSLNIEDAVRVNTALIGLMQTMGILQGGGMVPGQGGPPQLPGQNGNGMSGRQSETPKGQTPARNPNGVPSTLLPQANASPSPEAGANTTAPRPGAQAPVGA